MGKKIIAVVIAIIVIAAAVVGVYFLRFANKDTSATKQAASVIAVDDSNDKKDENYEQINLSVIKVTDKEKVDQSLIDVLGEQYNSFYLRLDSNNNIRLNLGYNAQSGTYSKSSDTINVTFPGKEIQKYTVVYSPSDEDKTNIAYVVVPYNNYLVYFG